MFKFLKKNSSSEFYNLQKDAGAESENSDRPKADEEFSTVAKIKIMVALMVVGFGFYAAYWAQQPVNDNPVQINASELKADTLNNANPGTTADQNVQAEQVAVDPPADPNVVDPNQANSNVVDPAADKLKVSMVNFKFDPPVLKIEKGQTVTWTNNDTVPHNVVGDDFSSGTLNPGETFSYTFSKDGKFSYKCSFHPQMTGEIDAGNVAANDSANGNDPAAVSSNVNALHNSADQPANSEALDALVSAANESSNLKPSPADYSLIDQAAAQSQLSGDLVASSTSNDPVQPLSVSTSKIIRSTKIPSAGPEDFVYITIGVGVLYANRKRMGMSTTNVK